ncbi:hypothetical protein ABZX77_47535 [Streptomyces sp. NPDC004237]|uniref:hypothetical protein n=1 Tax=Streptomyces sp. NPDC004237 TaxID=3154455 RepID=UPI0033B80903
MPHPEDPAPFPPGWPKGRYLATRRAMKVLRLADHLLRNGTAYTPNEATDELIHAAASQTDQGAPSETTCALVRAVLMLLLAPALTASPADGDTSRRVVRMVLTMEDRPTT